jgi:hypothetical protein
MSEEAMMLIYLPTGVVSVPAETFSRLDEWGNWARPRFGIEAHGTCASAEGRYESQYPDDGRKNGLQPDLQAVLAVERVVCTKLPRLPRELIRRHFVFRSTPKIIVHSLGIHYSKLGDELRRSVLMVRNNLTRV